MNVQLQIGLFTCLSLAACGEKGNVSGQMRGSGSATGASSGAVSTGSTDAGSPSTGSGSSGSTNGSGGSAAGTAGSSGSTVSPSDASASGQGSTTSPSDASEASAGEDAQVASDGGSVTASCAGTTHPLCIDFEDGKVDPPWTLSANDTAIETGNAAHGRYALHLSNLKSHPSLYLQTTKMPGIKDVLWGRFYLYMEPAAPLGHGDIVRANDVNTNWYEVGFAQPGTVSTTNPTTGCYLSDWHTGVSGVPEKGQPSQSVIPAAKYACVEFYFDGATPAVGQVWSDGVEVQLAAPPATPIVQKAVQFVSFAIGITLYHGDSLVNYNDDTPPDLTDEWLDDIALDTTRIGCL
jgi:hypothetical protein